MTLRNWRSAQLAEKKWAFPTAPQFSGEKAFFLRYYINND
jgi:hypothetical protein